MLLLFGSDRIESDGTEFNNNLRLVATVDDVDETWEEPPGGSVAATMTSAVDTIYPTDTDVDFCPTKEKKERETDDHERLLLRSG